MQTKLGSLIERRITVGNIATMIVFLVGWAISGAVWYTQVQGHVNDVEQHRTTAEEQKIIDDRVHLLTDASNLETQRRLQNIEQVQEEMLKVLYQIKGQLEKGR